MISASISKPKALHLEGFYIFMRRKLFIKLRVTHVLAPQVIVNKKSHFILQAVEMTFLIYMVFCAYPIKNCAQ